ncbi:hypothetical protein [Nocardia paucivorans]|uniref:hypothetical protein n=1 Tax=Nocardia paucivorans TaxID=114259 RepID=UPI0002D93B5D|nr:hypothetical protein [Nocardia paucivorans]
MIGPAEYRQRIVDAQRQWDEERFAAFVGGAPVDSGFRGELEPPSIPGPDDYDTLTLEQSVAAVEQMNPAAVHAAGRVWRDIATQLAEGARAFDERFRHAVEGVVGRAGWTGSAARAAVDGVRRCTEAVTDLALAAQLIALGLAELGTGLELTRSSMPAPCERPEPRDITLPPEGITKEGDYLLEEAEDEARRVLRTIYAPAVHRADLGVPVLPGPPAVVDAISSEISPETLSGSNGGDKGEWAVTRRSGDEGPRSGDMGVWAVGREQSPTDDGGYGSVRAERDERAQGTEHNRECAETPEAVTKTSAATAEETGPSDALSSTGRSTGPGHFRTESVGAFTRPSAPTSFVAPDLFGLRSGPGGPRSSARAAGVTDSAAPTTPETPDRREPGPAIASAPPWPGRRIADASQRSGGTDATPHGGAAGASSTRAAVMGQSWSAVPITARGVEEEKENRSAIKEYLITAQNGAELIGSDPGPVTVQPVWTED